MGFNLTVFFEKLLEDLKRQNDRICDEELKRIIEGVEGSQNYAKECGIIGE